MRFEEPSHEDRSVRSAPEPMSWVSARAGKRQMGPSATLASQGFSLYSLLSEPSLLPEHFVSVGPRLRTLGELLRHVGAVASAQPSGHRGQGWWPLAGSLSCVHAVASAGSLARDRTANGQRKGTDCEGTWCGKGLV